MTLQEIRKLIADFKRKSRDAHAKVLEEEINGEVKFVEVSMRFKVDQEKKA